MWWNHLLWYGCSSSFQFYDAIDALQNSIAAFEDSCWTCANLKLRILLGRACSRRDVYSFPSSVVVRERNTCHSPPHLGSHLFSLKTVERLLQAPGRPVVFLCDMFSSHVTSLLSKKVHCCTLSADFTVISMLKSGCRRCSACRCRCCNSVQH